MTFPELRDPDEARRFLFQGLWLQRSVPPAAATVRPTLERAWEIASAGHPLPPARAEMVNALIAAVRRPAEVLGPEARSELEHGTFVPGLGQRLAHRLVVQTARRREDPLPRHKVRPLAGRQEVPTRVLDEDT